MKITIDNRNTDIIYVDKINNHAVKGDEVLKLINEEECSNIDVYLKIIASGYKLNDIEFAVLDFLFKTIEPISVSDVYNDLCKKLGRSVTTIVRGITSLRDKKLVYITANNIVNISKAIKVKKDNIVKAKFIVIEINPKESSKLIDLI